VCAYVCVCVWVCVCVCVYTYTQKHTYAVGCERVGEGGPADDHDVVVSCRVL